MTTLQLILQRGDILSTEAHVCVSSIHRSKDMSTGPLARHILRNGGIGIQNELYKRQPDRDLAHGQVEELPPGKLKNCKELMFVCLYEYRPGNEEVLLQSILECLELAAVKEYKTISFPALGTGQGYPPEKVATCLIQAVALHRLQYPHTVLQTVFIVLMDKNIEMIKVFLRICAQRSTDLESEQEVEQLKDGGDGESGLMDNLAIQDETKFGTQKTVNGSQSRGQNNAGSQKPHGPQNTRRPDKTAVSLLTGLAAMASRFRNKGVSVRNGYFQVGVQPNISPKRIGVQVNFDVDIAFFTDFIPAALEAFWRKLKKA